MATNNLKSWNIQIHNGKPVPCGSKLNIPATSYHLLQKSQSLNEKCWTIFRGEKSQENGPSAEKNDKTEGARRLGRKKEEKR